MTRSLAAVVRSFALPGVFAGAEPWGSGHIHDTYRVTLREPGRLRPLLVQRINTEVFPDPAVLARTVLRTTGHLRAKLAARGIGDVDRRVLRPIGTRDGSPYHRHADGTCWRACVFVEGARTHDRAGSARMAREAAFAFGRFHHDLADLPPPPLEEILPHFHDTPARFQAFRGAVDADSAGRARGAGAEIDFALAREATASILREAHEAGAVPERVAHNDTKLDNLLFDDRTGEAICVIDLDTVMPGLGLHDFGDLVRTAATAAREDERDAGRVHVRADYFAALVDGFSCAMGDLLTRAERELLVAAARVITLETGLRFLTDHLQGDVYFRITRPDHNLDRARNQFALVRSLEAQEAVLGRIARRGS